MNAFKASFSASTEYQKIYNETTTTSSTYTSTYTQCACYSASLKTPYALPEFDENFIGAVKNMPLFYNNSDADNLQCFYDFFTKYFGIYYITQITMGGIFGTLSSMYRFSYSKYSSSNLGMTSTDSISADHIFFSEYSDHLTFNKYNVNIQQISKFQQNFLC